MVVCSPSRTGLTTIRFGGSGIQLKTLPVPPSAENVFNVYRPYLIYLNQACKIMLSRNQMRSFVGQSRRSTRSHPPNPPAQGTASIAHRNRPILIRNEETASVSLNQGIPQNSGWSWYVVAKHSPYPPAQGTLYYPYQNLLALTNGGDSASAQTQSGNPVNRSLIQAGPGRHKKHSPYPPVQGIFPNPYQNPPTP